MRAGSSPRLLPMGSKAPYRVHSCRAAGRCMDATAEALMALGSLFIAGMAAELLGRYTRLPRVTLFLILGFAVGPAGLDFLPENAEEWFPPVSIVALVMVGFLLGGSFTLQTLRDHGRDVAIISIAVVLVTASLVFAGLLMLGTPVPLALVLAAIAPATAPAATIDVVHESKARGPFTRSLLGIVAVDDAWGVILFSFVLACVPIVMGNGPASVETLLGGAWDVVGAILLGIVLGLPMAYLTGRIRPGEPTLAEALGVVLLCGGVSLWLDVSYLLSSIVLGVVVVNRARHHRRPFRAIEGIEWPFLALFFILAGASLRPQALLGVGFVGLGYVVLRVAGKLLGAWLGGVVARSDRSLRRWMGLSLIPQAGVAMGMTLVVVQQYPELQETVLPIIIGSTVLFELIGPAVTRAVLGHLGEVGAGDVGS